MPTASADSGIHVGTGCTSNWSVTLQSYGAYRIIVGSGNCTSAQVSANYVSGSTTYTLVGQKDRSSAIDVYTYMIVWRQGEDWYTTVAHNLYRF